MPAFRTTGCGVCLKAVRTTGVKCKLKGFCRVVQPVGLRVTLAAYYMTGRALLLTALCNTFCTAQSRVALSAAATARPNACCAAAYPAYAAAFQPALATARAPPIRMGWRMGLAMFLRTPAAAAASIPPARNAIAPLVLRQQTANTYTLEPPSEHTHNGRILRTHRKVISRSHPQPACTSSVSRLSLTRPAFRKSRQTQKAPPKSHRFDLGLP